jgi:hypothetical protein
VAAVRDCVGQETGFAKVGPQCTAQRCHLRTTR